MAFRLVNVGGRAALATERFYFDLEKSSRGAFGPDCMDAIARFEMLSSVDLADMEPDGNLADTELGPPVPRPRQIFGVGLNYRAHAEEFDSASPDAPLIFAKFPASIIGPGSDIVLRGTEVDWEVELVAVIGKAAKHVSRRQAWNYVAGLTIGQDISDRKVQFAGSMPQFSMGKSFDTYSPIGPMLVSSDLVPDRNDLEIRCDVSGERKQSARTSQMIFDIPYLIEAISSVVTMLPGDLIFTGTPAGVGMASGCYLKEGDTIESHVEGIGTLLNRCVMQR